MPLHDLELPPEVRDIDVEQYNARLGLVLFAVYLVGYVAFVLACVVMTRSFPAVLAGMALIGGAMVISLIYMILCQTPKGSS
jgi:cytochrome b subunit of formate dehydrogenase